MVNLGGNDSDSTDAEDDDEEDVYPYSAKNFDEAGGGFQGKQPPGATPTAVPDGQSLAGGNWTPHKIMAQWRNGDGIKQVTILIALTGGTACASTEGIDVSIQQDGHLLVVSEEWTDYMKDINSFYKHYQNAHDTLELDDHYARRLAMKDALRTLSIANGGNISSVHQCYLPFRVDGSEVDYSIHGDKFGGRYVHIDLAERSKIKVRKVNIMEDTVNDFVPSSDKKAPKYATFHGKYH